MSHTSNRALKATSREPSPAGKLNPLEDRLLTVPQVAERWSCSRQHVYNQLARGGLPSVTLGRSRRIRVTDVVAYENAHQVAV